MSSKGITRKAQSDAILGNKVIFTVGAKFILIEGRERDT
jgi:hypothetical protein